MTSAAPDVDEPSALSLAEQAESALKALIYATRAGLDDPAEAAAILAHLVLAVAHLPQTLREVSDYISGLNTEGRLRHDTGADLGTVVWKMQTAADSTAIAAAELGKALELGHNTASALTSTPVPPPQPTAQTPEAVPTRFAPPEPNPVRKDGTTP